MSKLEIIVMGMLNKNKMYGYEIVKFFKDTGFHVWMRIKLPSIYKVLARLEEKDLISKKKIIQEDGIPKNEFSLTQEGKNLYPKALKEFILKKNSINFFEFIFFTLIMEKSVTKETFIKAIDIQIDQFKENIFKRDKKHQALRRLFPGQNFISDSIINNFKEIRNIHLRMLNEIRTKALTVQNESYFITEER